MATNTSKTYLYHKVAAVYEKLVDITSYPDVFAAPARLDATTLSNTQRVYIPDITDIPEMTFGALYAVADYSKVKALQGVSTDYAIWFGDLGVEGKFGWTGDIFVTPKGGGVGAVREAEITCYPSTEITKLA